MWQFWGVALKNTVAGWETGGLCFKNTFPITLQTFKILVVFANVFFLPESLLSLGLFLEPHILIFKRKAVQWELNWCDLHEEMNIVGKMSKHYSWACKGESHIPVEDFINL